jgi:NAD kinase
MTLETTVPEDLFDSYVKSEELRQKHGLTKGLAKFTKMTDYCKRQINYVVTLGGDGTILWASKQFSGEFIPPMITFSQGSLGFMCNFVFDEHEEVLNQIFQKS